ncbi:hypothetical protein I2485_00360 [Nesterenkonia sp. E16_7]|uniref:hypothetical protein n=1 Tax=unclassified Nesterenkonia TaxID=2629769 RepID=UPI001A92A8E3|nr:MULTISPECIES: hypothetical protein [unclassified Nesterenkonia]MBO0594849.1 hypothetical protein [Nesterenkonia sp. E16_10]MBO0597098.1 hypothetical protein [Nesterenkonia sp. E16_7]
MTLKTTGLLGIALLALTACGEDEGTNTSTPDTEQAEDDSDAQDGTGSEPAETDEEATSDENDDDDSEEAPGIEEIHEDLWESSLNQESVSISADVLLSAIGEGSEALEQGSDGEGDDDEVIQVEISGDMDGDGYTYTMADGVIDLLVFSDVALQSADSVVAEYEGYQDAEQGASPEELREAVEAEGDWVDITSLAAQFETPRGFIENFRASMMASSDGEDLSDWDAQGEVDTHDGEDVWVYSEEGNEESLEIIVRADFSEPVLMEIRANNAGQETSVTFTSWNESDAPDRPADETIISEEEFQGIEDSMF